MEVFGLLNLLNSLLPSPPQRSEEPPVSPSTAPANGETPPAPEGAPPNACLDFFAQHEQRAKQRKGGEKR